MHKCLSVTALFGDLYLPKVKTYAGSIISCPLTSKDIFSGYSPENVRQMGAVGWGGVSEIWHGRNNNGERIEIHNQRGYGKIVETIVLEYLGGSDG